MKVYQWRPVYLDGQPDEFFRQFRNASGVYEIRFAGEDHSAPDYGVRYVGVSNGRLKKTMLRHFQKWRDKSVVRTKGGGAYEKYHYTATGHDQRKAEVRITVTTPAQAAKLELDKISRYKPEGNRRGIPTQEEVPF